MRRFDAFSDHDFELLVADLLGAVDGVRYEVFTRGADGGIDVRFSPGEGEPPDIVQCKHFAKSTFSKLETAVKAEAKILAAMPIPPRSYRLVTTQTLTPANKTKLVDALSGFVASTGDIIGLHELDLLLSAHEPVERRHPKLWLTGSGQLERAIRAGTYERSRRLLEKTQESLQRYVETEAFFTGRELLRDGRVLLIAGPPGIGKTTLAQMLLVDSVLEGYEPIDVTQDIEEANSVFSPDALQIFYYDDFLGTTFLRDRLPKNEDQRIVEFVRKVAGSATSRMVFTTREYILQQAEQVYEAFGRERLGDRKYLLELKEYSTADRAKILYNHVWHSADVTPVERKALAAGRGYRRILDHENYNPRLIEFVTGAASREMRADLAVDYVEMVVRVLSRPSVIWDHAFDEQLGEAERALLLVLSSMPSEVASSDLQEAFLAHCASAGISTRGKGYKQALRVLDDSFARTFVDRKIAFVEPVNPSIIDFSAEWLRESPTDAQEIIEGCMYFEQLPWLYRTLGPHKLLAEAVERCWGSINPTWGWWSVSGKSGELARYRGRVSPAVRLQFVLRLIRENTGIARALSGWFDQRVEEESASWRSEHVFDGDSPISLVAALREAGRLTATIRADVKAYVLRNSDSVYDWKRVVRLIDVCPEAFEDGELDEVQEDFLAFAQGVLETGYESLDDTDDLDAIESIAVRLDVELDREAFDEAARWIDDQVGEREEEALEGAKGASVDGPRHFGVDSHDLDALFARLAES